MISMNFKWLENYNLINLESTDSTNTEALNLARHSIKNNHVIVAEEQSASRGSRGKGWFTMPGNLNCSILLVNVGNIKHCSSFPFILANVLQKTLHYFAHLNNIQLDIASKWPNDILINGKKVAGILVETISVDGENYVVIGFGINVVLTPVITNAQFSPTSLANEGLYIDDKKELLNCVIANFDIEYQKWLINKDFNPIRKKWLENAYHLNECITITDGQKRISGIFKDITSIGEIVMELSNGRVISYNHGDVI
ncbi:MAG: hypothetical protein DGJ47_000118 [Rickettsiaceae bacterium]